MSIFYLLHTWEHNHSQRPTYKTHRMVKACSKQPYLPLVTSWCDRKGAQPISSTPLIPCPMNQGVTCLNITPHRLVKVKACPLHLDHVHRWRQLGNLPGRTAPGHQLLEPPLKTGLLGQTRLSGHSKRHIPHVRWDVVEQWPADLENKQTTAACALIFQIVRKEQICIHTFERMQEDNPKEAQL